MFNKIYTLAIIYYFLLLCTNAYPQNEVNNGNSKVEDKENDNTIKILVKQPDMPSTVQAKQWEMNYENLINNFLKEKNVNDSLLKDIQVSFNFFEYYPVNENNTSEYLNYFKSTIDDWINSKYDMMILDDRILFSDKALIETDSVEYYFKSRTPTKDHLLDLTDYIDMNSLQFNDQKILQDAQLDGKLYGLPYEMDYDLLYHINLSFNMTHEEFKESIRKYSWEDLLKHNSNSNSNSNIQPFVPSFGDEDDFLNFFLEYAFNNYELSLENGDFFNVFFNKNADSLFNLYKEYVYTVSKNNLNNTIYISQDDACQAFLNEKVLFFKGKASHHTIINNVNINTLTNINLTTLKNNTLSQSLQRRYESDTNDVQYNNQSTTSISQNTDSNENEQEQEETTQTKKQNNNNTKTKSQNNQNTTTTSTSQDNSLINTPPPVNTNTTTTIDNSVVFTLPPKYYSIVNEKYLVVNRHSKKNVKILTEIAKQLTSKEMQLLRAKQFGAIPTFDLTQTEKDQDIQSYCQSEPEICENSKVMKRIYIKDVFASEYSPSFFEIRLFLPSLLKRYIYNNSDLEALKLNFKNIKHLITSDMSANKKILPIVLGGLTLWSLIIMSYVYRYRNHPYILVISSKFCSIIILGLILSINAPLLVMPPYSTLIAKISYIYDAITYTLIILPMFGITYRIIKIYKSKLITPESFHDKYLFAGMGIVFFIYLAYKLVIVFTHEFYYISSGYINKSRYPKYYFNNCTLYFICLICALFKAGEVSKKITNILFIISILFLTIVNYIVSKFYNKLATKNYSINFLFLSLLYSFIAVLCIYLLIVKRIFYIALYESELAIVCEQNKNYIPSKNLVGFIPLIKSKEHYYYMIDKYMNRIDTDLKNSCSINLKNSYSINHKNSSSINIKKLESSIKSSNSNSSATSTTPFSNYINAYISGKPVSNSHK
eukprot:jgi/Orpsp1_1/1182129/evm.model.c7180000080020.1